ncbi:MAG: tRNA (N6-isopentenyl adenosine(37)-C2)-methylthiotransferase MiaB [Proteobacteria bacterium]|nr:tRNA (N6-isopentenyl adenosine(37)-C2)-methylthiotransferase MiaB [Pseudomonadota bacterium]
MNPLEKSVGLKETFNSPSSPPSYTDQEHSTATEVTGRVFIETFGCQMNENDSDRVRSILEESGYREVDTPESADLILLNTCSVRDKAEQKVYSLLGRFKPLKAKRPKLVLAVLGCVAQQEGVKLLSRIRYLDMVVGPQNIHRLGELVEGVRNGSERVVATAQSETITEDEYSVPTRIDGFKAFVPIMRGCNNYCAYCIVPYTRGREVSRDSADLLAEIAGIAGRGVKEVTLIGQNVNSYAPVKEGEREPYIDFTGLLKEVAKVEGIERIRFITSHPKDISAELIELIGTEAKIVPSIHLPVQSGSEEILKSMGRGYTAAEYLATVNALKAARPGVALSSDIIVGFPGETEADFCATMALIEEVRYDNLYSFKYSPRPGTRAALFDSQVEPSVASERLQRLQKRQREISAEKSADLKGGYVEVLVEGPSKGDAEELMGRTPCNRVVNFEQTAPGLELEAGEIVKLLITDVYPNSLRGLYTVSETRPVCL